MRLGCHVLGVSDEVFRSPELKRAKVAVRKNGGFNARARMFLGHEMIRRIVALANPSSAVEWSLAMMFLATYISLLRLPSGALPMTVGGIGCGQWKSPAFLVYLDLETLDKGAGVEAHRDESSSDDED